VFQRASVELARAGRNVISGCVGDHGVMFLVAGAGSGARAGRALVRLGERAATLAKKRFGLALHLGTSSVTGSAPLSVRYQEALAAAENAVSQGISIAHAASGGSPDMSAIRKLRAQLGGTTEVRPKELIPRFEHYLEAVMVHAGYRLDLAQAHLMAGFDQAAQALLSARALEPKSHEAMQESLDKAARGASTLSELFAAYRRAVAELVDAVERPVSASRDRSLRRAIDFIHQHFTEPMTSRQVAKIAGFAPGYFCQLFKRRERMTFEQYLRRLRIEHAKQLLLGTDLSVERVGQLSGYALRHYFHRVFRRSVGVTPIAFRESER
jgi:AraC-like DNA-binding protein